VTKAAAAVAATPAPPPAARKLSFKEQRELDALPARIDALETEQKTISERLASTELYTDEPPKRVAELQARYAAIEEELLAALERWEILGSR
jgi:ATP-binding cassette subfamily F protein uup